MRTPPTILLLLLCAAGPADTDDQAALGEMTVSSTGGPARTCKLTSFSLSTDRSRQAGDPGDPVHIATAMTRDCVVRDAGLLDWVAGRDPKRLVVVTLAAPAGGQALRYEMDGADAVGFSATHSDFSSQEAVQLTLDHLRINGHPVF